MKRPWLLLSIIIGLSLIGLGLWTVARGGQDSAITLTENPPVAVTQAATALPAESPTVAPAQPAPELRVAPEVGALAPDFILMDLNGDLVKLSDFRRQPVLINFWASWCAPCRVEMLEIEAAYRQYQEQGFVVVGVNLLFQDSKEGALAFVESSDLTFPVLLDESGEAAAAYRVRAIPSSVFVNGDGVITDIFYGPMTKEIIEDSLVKILGG